MKISRREALLGLGTASAGTFLSRCSKKPAYPQANILLVMTDDQAYNQMSCAGHAILQTPNIDRLAREGVRFTNAFCTNSLCAPSLATVLTGSYSHIHGIRVNSEERDGPSERIDPRLPVFPAVLRAAGYRTGLIGKWHLRQDPAGFDDWKILPAEGSYDDPDFLLQGHRQQQYGYATDITTDFALDFLRQAGRQPFCLLYQHQAPRRPFTPAPRHAKLFEDIAWPYPESYLDDYATRRIAKEAEDMRLEIGLASDYDEIPKNLRSDERRDWIFQRFVKDHHRAVYGVDENLGRILEHLDVTGRAEDTVVIYTSDNGYFLGEHGWYGKRFMYEPALRIPLIVRYPRLGLPASLEDRFVLNTDLAPTILDFAGLAAPKQMQGRSLRPLLEGNPPEDWRPSMFYAYYDNSGAQGGLAGEEMVDRSVQDVTRRRIGPHRGIRTGRYKLIEYYADGGYWELFDLESDPHELRNLHGQSGFQELTADLTQRLRRLQRDLGEAG